MSIEDIDGCIDVASDVGWTTPRSYWALLLRFGDAYGLVEDGALAGTVIAFPHEAFTFIGMMLVRRRLQRRGYARLLLEHAVERTNGAPLALVATEMGEPLYRKLGFVERERIVTYNGRWNGAFETSVTIRVPRRILPATREAIVSADARAFGTRRTLLMTALFAQASGVATIERDGMLSYAFAWQQGTVTRIGPVVAVDDNAASTLVAALASHSRTECRISIPAARTALRKAVEAHGLSPLAEVPLMTRGAVPRSQPCWYAIALASTG